MEQAPNVSYQTSQVKHFYQDVPQLGSVALSHHAQIEAQKDGITDDDIERVLFNPAGPDVHGLRDHRLSIVRVCAYPHADGVVKVSIAKKDCEVNCPCAVLRELSELVERHSLIDRTW